MQRAWLARGGALLLGLAGLLLAAGLVGLVSRGGGMAFLILGLPPAGAGFLVIAGWPPCGSALVSVALAYAAFALYVATAPLRGLTPADGAPFAGTGPGPDRGRGGFRRRRGAAARGRAVS